jgi:hypothetical protein
MPFRWIGMFPLIGVALQEEIIDQAIQWAMHDYTAQQRLPDDLNDLLTPSLPGIRAS